MSRAKQHMYVCQFFFVALFLLRLCSQRLLSLYVQDTVQKGESRDYTRLKKMFVRYLERKAREKHFSLERHFVKLASGATAATGKSKLVHWTTKCQCYRGEKRDMKHDPEKNRESKGKRKGFARKSWRSGIRKRLEANRRNERILWQLPKH